MNASSASGLWARWIVRDALAATRRLAGRHLLRLVAEGVEVLRVLVVLRPRARALRAGSCRPGRAAARRCRRAGRPDPGGKGRRRRVPAGSRTPAAPWAGK